MIRTFVDSGVLLAGWRGVSKLQIKALTVLSDANREFVSSPFVRLELRPKAVYHKNLTEIAFYDSFFSTIVKWIDENSIVVAKAEEIGEKYGLNSMDALHIAASILAKSDEFVTTERPTSPFSRVQDIKIVFIN
jgi:predicted nucleic acid-binding protein